MVDDEAPLGSVLTDFNAWLEQEGLLSKNFAFVTCGDWDLADLLPTQCRYLGLAVPSYFKSWINIKMVRSHSENYTPARSERRVIKIKNKIKNSSSDFRRDDGRLSSPPASHAVPLESPSIGSFAQRDRQVHFPYRFLMAPSLTFSCFSPVGRPDDCTNIAAVVRRLRLQPKCVWRLTSFAQDEAAHN